MGLSGPTKNKHTYTPSCRYLHALPHVHRPFRCARHTSVDGGGRARGTIVWSTFHPSGRWEGRRLSTKHRRHSISKARILAARSPFASRVSCRRHRASRESSSTDTFERTFGGGLSDATASIARPGYAEATISLRYSRRAAGIRPLRSRTSVFAAPSARSRKAAS